jgi:hypothetical protein
MVSNHLDLTLENACWSGFTALYLPTLDQLEETFSHVGSSSSEPDARIYLTQRPSDAGPSTVVWTSPKPTWGQWTCLSFSYCISIMTERDADTLYAVDTSEPESEPKPKSPLLPVNECTMDGVIHLGLVVPNRPSVDGMVQLSEEQMRAAVEFYDRSSLSSGPSVTATATATRTKDIAVDPYDCKWEDENGDAGYHLYYADARNAGAGAVLLSCADGNEVDAVALAVLLLARHHSRSHSHPQGLRDAARGLGAHAFAADAGQGIWSESYTAYQASKLIDDDPQVSHVWKGLLEWQDVERVQAALLSCV